ncbi:Baseplate Assembly protein W [Enterobacter kobei]|nr:Baseplate Assembly protein W [Enterobacter kobei]
MTVRYLRMNIQTGLSISEVEHIRQSVRDVLVTPIGSRTMRREDGSLLSALIDQPQTATFRLQIMAACYSAIQKWEPRVSLTTIAFKRSEHDGGLYVEITGTRSASTFPRHSTKLNAMAIVALNQLAAPDIVEVLDYETIPEERKATLITFYPEEQQEAIVRTLTLESGPIMKLLEENPYRYVIW